MILYTEHAINLDEIMGYVSNEIARAIDEEGVDWDSLTDAS